MKANTIERIFAQLIDNLLLSILYIAIYLATYTIYGIITIKYYNFILEPINFNLIVLSTLITLFISCIISALFENSEFHGTPGKIIMCLNVKTLGMETIGFWKSVIRFLLKILFIPIFPINILFIALSFEKQSLHDRITNTQVIIAKENVRVSSKYAVFPEIYDEESLKTEYLKNISNL